MREPDPLDPRTPLETRTPIGPRSGVELPPLPLGPYDTDAPYEPDKSYDPGSPFVGPEGVEPTGEHHTTPIDRAALRRPVDPVPTPSPTVYKTRRAGVVGLVAGVALVAELLLIRVLLVGEFGHTVAPGAVLAGLFAMAGIPLVALGLYGLITGPAATAGPEATRAWLRTPLAYLPIGLALLLAAGLAAG
jgi:hypothetical protein